MPEPVTERSLDRQQQIGTIRWRAGQTKVVTPGTQGLRALIKDKNRLNLCGANPDVSEDSLMAVLPLYEGKEASQGGRIGGLTLPNGSEYRGLINRHLQCPQCSGDTQQNESSYPEIGYSRWYGRNRDRRLFILEGVVPNGLFAEYSSARLCR
jgi:hypothetical protein